MVLIAALSLILVAMAPVIYMIAPQPVIETPVSNDVNDTVEFDIPAE